MEIKEALSFLQEHCSPAVKSGVLTPDDRVSIRGSYGIWITKSGADLSSLAEKDITGFSLNDYSSQSDKIAELHGLLFASHKRLGAIISSRTRYALAVSRTGETVRPYVDDIAQIAGINIKCAPLSGKDKIKSLFKRRGAILIKDSGSICADTSLDNALAAAMITEKACRIHIQSRYLGGAKAINIIESALMRFLYIKKYSKIKY